MIWICINQIVVKYLYTIYMSNILYIANMISLIYQTGTLHIGCIIFNNDNIYSIVIDY